MRSTAEKKQRKKKRSSQAMAKTAKEVRGQMVKIFVFLSFTLLLMLNVIVLQIWFEIADMQEYLDAIYNEISICEDLNDEYILLDRGARNSVQSGI